MSRLLRKKNWLASLLVVALVVALLPVTPARAATTHTAAVAGSRWKPASKRNWWDRLWGLHDSNKVPKKRDLKVGAVPRKDPVVKGSRLAPVKRIGELTSRRTANARYFKLSNGQVQAEISPQPVNYRSGRTWKPIDTKVTRSGTSGFAYGNRTNSFRTLFGTKAGELVRFDAGGGASLTFGPEKTGAAKPVVRGNTVTYAAAAGADLSYVVRSDSLKESIVLAKAPVSASWSFAVRAKGLRAWQRRDGSIAFYRGGFDGPPALVMPRPYMSDAKADAASPYGKAWSPKVAQSMRWDAKAGLLHITVTADSKWLNDPKRVFPVLIDPTIVLQPLPENSQDTMIESDTPDANYEDSWRLSVGTTTGGAARALVKFPIDIPTATKIASAELQMYYDQTFVSNSQDVTIEAHRATAPWDETTATWNNASDNVGELGDYQVTVDDGDVGTTSQQGAWPAATSTYATNGDYLYNKDSVSGDTYTWTPKLLEDGNYRVEAHYVAAGGQATNAPYTVTYNGGSAPYAVNQQSGTNGVWADLGTHPFTAGTTGKVSLGDGPASTSTAVIADATRWTKDGAVVRPAGDQGSHWHSFPVKNIVQSWVDGTNPDYGFVLKAADEATLGMGGPRYEGSVYAYNGETVQYPKLVITYGKPGVAVEEPTTIHATGADLSWPAYQDPSSSSKDDIVEYQVHRSIYQDFTPSAATLVAPVDKNITTFSDTTATPTPADSADPYGNLYYYMVAVKTADGSIVPGPTQIVRLPKAGRTVKVYQASGDTTLSSLQPSTNEDQLAGQAWLSVGNDSSTYGVTHSVIKFPAMTGIATSAQVVDARVKLWSAGMTGNAQATYDVHGLTRDFDETTATWNKATSATSWTSAGGDYTSAVAGSFGPITNDPAARTFPITSLAQGWVTTPSSDHGVLFRLANETTPGEHTTFLSSEAGEPDLRPQLLVTYLDKTSEDTYYAPATPSRMIPGDQYTVNVDVTDTTTRTLTQADYALSYKWTLPDGTDVTDGGNQLQTVLPKDIVSGETVTIPAQLKTPIQSRSGNKRTDYVLHWDLYNKTTGQWLSTSDGIGSLDQAAAVEDPTSDQLGLEKFYQYAGKNTGAGGTVMDNLYAGNAVWSYNPINNPGRGLSTFVRMAYNSLDTSDSSMGYGWSLQAAGPARLGSPLDLHPNPNPTTVTMTDGDGTSHTFSWDATANEWKAPAGVHYYLQRQVVCDNKTEESRAWLMTRPGRSQFFYDCDGYLSAVVDKNGNTQDFTYAARKSNNKPIKFLTYITDPAGRQSLTLDYYAKGDDYTYIDDSGNEVQDSNLTNPHIIDQVKSVTDISGRTITFTYTTQGLMAKMVDGAGDSQAKTFSFTYDATQGNKNVKLVSVKDPRGHTTGLDYYYPQTGDDPQFHWDLKTITDRLSHDTGFAYTDPDGTSGSTIQTVVTDPETHATTYVMDGFGRPTQTTNAKNQQTLLGWDADNNVTRLEEDNGAVTTWTYDPLTGYPLTQTDAEANKNGTAATVFGYQYGLGGHFADLISKTSPEGRVYTFGYDAVGNLSSVTDPAGNATSTADDYTTHNDYGAFGLLAKVTDANGHATQYLDYDDSGYPQTITDPLNKSTTFVYDVRGQVTKVTDPLGDDTTQNYDVFGRPLDKSVAKDHAAMPPVFITTPAPVYDANDNVLQSTAPNGAVTTASYDDADQLTSSTAPQDTSTSPVRTTSYAYDEAGNVTKVTEPKGTLTTSDDTDYVTSYGYDEIYESTSVTNANGDKLTYDYDYDDVGNVTTVIDPRKNATTDTTDYTTKYTYDLNHRVKIVTDAAGYTTQTGYDRDGLTTSTTDQNNTTTVITLDARGKPYQVKIPHAAGTDNITQYEYDQVGNQTKVITPRGVATTGVPDDFVQQTNYDELNRVKEKLTPYDPNDARYNHPDKTIYSYDDAGRLATVSAPPSEGQSVRNDTTYTYFDNGWTKTSTDPWDIATSYDYNDLGQQSSRTLTSAGGSSARTMGWTYYPDGKLKGRTDDGVPVGQQVVLVDDSDIQNAGYNGTPWTTASSGTGYQGYDYATHTAGTGSNTFSWNLTIPEDGSYQVYAKYPTVSGAATNASYTVRDGTGTATAKTVDQTSSGGTWVSLGSYTFKRDGTGQQITLSDNANGTVVADAVKLVRDNSGDVDNEKTDFSYAYDPNANLTDITDNSPGTKIDAYTVTYDGLNQVRTVEEKAAGTVKHTTTYTYNENGEPATRGHDDESATYDYDVRDLVRQITDKASATDTTPKITSFTYTPPGQRDVETKGNGNTVDDDYYLDLSLQHQVEKKPDGTIVSEHTYSYDPNGNKSQDVAKTMNADDHAAYLNTTTNWTYDPLDRIAQVTKTGDETETETYVHDPNNNVVSQTIKGTTTTFNYDRNRLLTSAAGGATANYNYDPFGRLDTVTSAGKVIERETYDGFDRIAEHQQQNSAGSLVSTKYTYDPLDRTTSKTTDPGGANEKTTNYSYLGLTDQVLDEDVAGTITKSYQYSPWGERLSQVKTNTDGSKEDTYYGYNDHTDVEDITDSSGDTKATYGYTAYGQSDDAESTGIDKPDPADPTKEPYNAFRYEARRWDANSSTYDMGFRDYSPGLNQFLARDSYNGALDDQNLATDPFTANRYAFSGGNPVGTVELDGHTIDGGQCGYTSPCNSGKRWADNRFIDQYLAAQPNGAKKMQTDGIRGTVSVYDKNGNLEYYDSTLFSGLSNPGLGEKPRSLQQTHVEARALKLLERLGYLKKGNRIVIVVDDDDRQPCAYCNARMREAAKTGVGIVYRAPGYSQDYGDLGAGLTKDVGGPTVQDEIPKMRDKKNIAGDPLGYDERPPSTLKTVVGGPEGAPPRFRFRPRGGGGGGEGGSDTVPYELFPWAWVCEKNPSSCPLLPPRRPGEYRPGDPPPLA